jgi:hypothetical protein
VPFTFFNSFKRYRKMANVLQPPTLDIPPSSTTVRVSIIDTTCHVDISSSLFIEPEIPGHEKLHAPCFSFLIKHKNPQKPSKYDTILFDLGIRKDHENGPKSVVEQGKQGGVVIKVQKDVAEILRTNGEDPSDVGGIIWSHWHFVGSSWYRC